MPTSAHASSNGDRPPAAAAAAAASAPQPRTNPSLVVTADHRIRMEDAPVREPGAGEVLLHVRTTGICGSDMHFWRHGRIGDIVFGGDCILGHEPAGEVVKLGPGVTGLQPGDRVAVEPGVPCNRCFLCAEGRYNLCSAVAFAGVYPYHGTIQRYTVHAARYCHKLPDELSFAAAALLEPLSVALHALRTSPVHVGTPVAVFGAGPIGLLAMAVARASGAHPLVITDVDAARLAFAREFEPHCQTLQVAPGASPEETAQRVRALFEPQASAAGAPPAPDAVEYEMPALVLECTGIEASIATAAYTARRGGCVNVVGVSAKPLISGIPFMHLSLAEITLRFINRYRDTWPAGIRALQGKLIDPARLESLVTHTFALEDAVRAMELVGGVGGRAEGERVVKVQIVDGGDALAEDDGLARR